VTVEQFYDQNLLMCVWMLATSDITCKITGYQVKFVLDNTGQYSLSPWLSGIDHYK